MPIFGIGINGSPNRVDIKVGQEKLSLISRPSLSLSVTGVQDTQLSSGSTVATQLGKPTGTGPISPNAGGKPDVDPDLEELKQKKRQPPKLDIKG